MSENDGTLCILLKGVILTYGFFYGPHLLLEKLGCLCPRLSSRKGSATDSKEEILSKETIACAHAESLKLYHAFKNCEDKYIVDKLRSAMKIMSDALRLYGPEQLFSSYNGGKDADVTMYLLRAVIAKYSDERNTIYRPKVIYFAVNDEFPEVLQHIRESQRNFALDLVTCSGNIVQGIAQHIEGMKASNLNAPAFMLGTRRGDPNSADQQAFSPSSEWMPAFMSKLHSLSFHSSFRYLCIRSHTLFTVFHRDKLLLKQCAHRSKSPNTLTFPPCRCFFFSMQFQINM